MQYLKEKIKNRILSAALNEFNGNGFRDASMMEIAHDAKVAIGNIYRYFKNKDELFNEIMEPVYDQIATLIFNPYEKSFNSDMPFNVIDVVNTITEVYVKYGTELLIMMDKSEGSKYQNTKQELINLIYERQKNEYRLLFEENEITMQDSLIYVFSATLVEGIFIIFRKNVNVDKIKKQIDQFLHFYFNNFTVRFK